MTLEIHNPFNTPSHTELESYEDAKPRWWYAAQMRVAGAQWSEIAEALGYESDQTVMQAVRRARRDRSQDPEPLEDLVDLELKRLDALQLIMWKEAQSGDSKAINTILAIMQLRMKLLGTEKRPESADKVTNNTAIFIGGSTDEYKEALRKARMAGKAIEAEVVNG